MRSRFAAGGAVAAMLVLAAAPAEGATVGQEVFTGTLDVRAAPGEANEIAVRVEPGTGELSDVVVTQEGGTLDAGDGCEAQPDGSVACSLDLYIITVNLGDLDDELAVHNTDQRVQHTVYGGDGEDEVKVGPLGEVCVFGDEGNDRLRITVESGSCIVDGEGGRDVLTGSPGQDRLYGGEGIDRLFARGGSDYLNGGDDDDVLRAGTGDDAFIEGDGGDDVAFGEGGDDGFFDDPGDDVMYGGDGRDGFSSNFLFSEGDDLYLGGEDTDRMHYFCPACVVSFDGLPNDGRINQGERDDVRAEIAVIDSHRERGDEIPPKSYGTGADRMVGDAAANVLASQRGPDLLIGNGGHDGLRSGRGDDRILARDGLRDRVHCGAGHDEVVADPIDQLDDCEAVGP